MRNGCVEAGLPASEFKILPTMFSVTFHTRDNNKAVKKSNHKNSVGINETQRKILEIMLETPEVTAGQIAEDIGITKRRVESNISQLKALGVLERVGARKSGRWVVKQP